MFIAVEGIDANVPEDVRSFGVPTARARSLPDYGNTESGATESDRAREVEQLSALSDITLDRWDIQSHQYTTKAAVEASYLGRLFSGKAQASSYRTNTGSKAVLRP